MKMYPQTNEWQFVDSEGNVFQESELTDEQKLTKEFVGIIPPSITPLPEFANRFFERNSDNQEYPITGKAIKRD